MDKNSGFDDGRQVVEELIREAQEGFQETQLAVNDVIHDFTEEVGYTFGFVHGVLAELRDFASTSVGRDATHPPADNSTQCPDKVKKSDDEDFWQ